MKFEATIPSVLGSKTGHVNFKFNQQTMGMVVISRTDQHGDNLLAEVELSTLAKLTQAFAGETELHGINGLSLKELRGGGEFPLAFAEIVGFIDAFTRHRTEEDLKKTLANINKVSTEELIKNFDGVDLGGYLLEEN